jgi:NAD(P)H-nitrite reductase large subunit
MLSCCHAADAVMTSITSKARVVIVGGVAGGASTAARLRRLYEACDIDIIERGKFVSFANCGLPYFVGNTIPKEGNLIVATTHLFSRRFNINCHTEHEVVDVRAGDKVVRVRNLVTMEEHDRPYDALVLATGASALVPPIAGVDLNVTTGKPSTPGVFVLRTIPDSNQVRIGCLLPAACCLLPAACCLLPAACCQSRVARLRGWTIVLFTAEETAVL